MSFAQTTIPSTQSALQWVRVSDTNPMEWNASAPVVQPSALPENHVLLENHAASLNPLDYKMPAVNFSKTKLPACVGFDVSGRVVAVGKGVNSFKVGDEVFGALNVDTSNGGGAFQQYSVAHVDGLVKKPPGISHTDAASLGVAYLSALDGLRQVKIDSSTTVFVPGGSGGVGHFIVQIAQNRGAKQVITSASKEEGIRILKEQYKVKDVINHAKDNVVDRVLELTNGQGADVVYDATYLESSFAKTTKTVKEGGSWIVLGQFAAEGSAEAKAVAARKAKVVHTDLARYWLGPERAQAKSYIGDGLTEAVKWIEQGTLKPYINQTIKLEEVKDTLEKLKQGQTGFGKVVVKFQ